MIKLLLINALSALSTLGLHYPRYSLTVESKPSSLPSLWQRSSKNADGIRWFSSDSQRIGEISNRFNASVSCLHVNQRRVKAVVESLFCLNL